MLKRLWMLSMLGWALALGTPAAAQEEVLFTTGEPDLSTATNVRYYMPAEDFVLPGEPGEIVSIQKIEFWVVDDGAFTDVCLTDPDMHCWSGILEYAIFEDVDSPDDEPSLEAPLGVEYSYLHRAPASEPLFGVERIEVETHGGISVEPTGRVGESVDLFGKIEYLVTFEPLSPIELEAGVTYWLGLHLAGHYGIKNIGVYWATSQVEYRPGWCYAQYASVDSEGNTVWQDALDGNQECETDLDCDGAEEGDGLGICHWAAGTFEQHALYSDEERAAYFEGYGGLRHLSRKEKFEDFYDRSFAQAQQLAFNVVPEPGAIVQGLSVLTILGCFTRSRRKRTTTSAQRPFASTKNRHA